MFLFLVTGIAFADQTLERKKYYIGIDGGLFSPSGSYEEAGITIAHNSSGNEFGLKYIYYFDYNLGLNFRLARTSFKSKKADFVASNGSGRITNHLTAQLEYEITTLGLGLSGRLPLLEQLDLQADGGINLNINKGTIAGDIDGRKFSESETGRKLGFFVNAGLNFMPISDISIGALIKYSINKQDIEGGGEADLSGISFLLAVGYMF